MTKIAEQQRLTSTRKEDTMTDCISYLRTYATPYDWQRETPYPLDIFFSLLDQFVEQTFYGFTHPLAKRLLAGQFTREELKFLAIQEYYYYASTTWWNAFKLGNADSLDQQRLLHDPLLDELGTDLTHPTEGLPAHSVLFLNYCEGLGITQDTIQLAPLATGVMLAVTELLRIAKERPHFEFIACSNLVVEKMRPRFYSELLHTFSHHYSWVPKKALIFYEVHAHLDVNHSSIGRQVVSQYATHSKREQDAIFSAILSSTALRNVMYDSIDQAIRSPGTDYGVIPWPNFPREPWPRPITKTNSVLSPLPLAGEG